MVVAKISLRTYDPVTNREYEETFQFDYESMMHSVSPEAYLWHCLKKCKDKMDENILQYTNKLKSEKQNNN